MPNPFNVLNQNNQVNTDFKQMYQSFINSKNPIQMFINMAGNNSQMQPIINYIRGGGDPQAMFNNLCQQRGINPREFIKNLTR